MLNSNHRARKSDLTPEQTQKLGGKTSTRWMKHKIGNAPGTTEMAAKGQEMLRKGNPLKMPDGTPMPERTAVGFP